MVAMFKLNPTASLVAVFAAYLLTGCQPAVPPGETGKPTAGALAVGNSESVPLPKIMARSCQGCHAVRTHLASPNPAAPGFADIANLEGLTPNTLRAFLRDAHNYPDEMKMTLTPQEVDAITAYVLTLVDPNYRPIP